MAGNTFGTLFRITTFGESHGAALGVIIDGCPPGIPLDESVIQVELNRRRPGAHAPEQAPAASLAPAEGQSPAANLTSPANVAPAANQSPAVGRLNPATTARKEADACEILSGVFEGKTTGTPIAVLIRNTNQKSDDYGDIVSKFRPGHADFTYFKKYGVRDYRGGGRSSGRETAARVAAGAVAKAFLESKGIRVIAWTSEAAGIVCESFDEGAIEANQFRACDPVAAARMLERVTELKRSGDSAGGIVSCRVTGVPVGLGEPAFDKLDAELAKAILSIGAVKGIEFGKGFESARMTGSEWNDPMRIDPATGKPDFADNHAGGILGGISNGADVTFRAAVKPVPSISKTQQTVDVNGNECDIEVRGRHDVCLCPRIVPVIESMTALTIADLYLRQLAVRG